MSDIQLAALLLALAAIVWYVRGGLERESGSSGVLDAKAPATSDRCQDGIRCLLWGHFASLLACIPLLAYNPFSLAEGHAMDRWLADYLTGWLLWAGLIQLVYLVPLWWSLRSRSRPAAARGLLLAGVVTAAASGLSWAVDLRRRPGLSLSVQAAAGVLGLAAVVALLWSARELRRRLKN
jgi:hypothetical protein